METPLTKEQKEQILSFIESEATRIGYGKVIFDVTVLAGKVVNIQGETRRSLDLKPANKGTAMVPA